MFNKSSLPQLISRSLCSKITSYQRKNTKHRDEVTMLEQQTNVIKMRTIVEKSAGPIKRERVEETKRTSYLANVRGIHRPGAVDPLIDHPIIEGRL